MSHGSYKTIRRSSDGQDSKFQEVLRKKIVWFVRVRFAFNQDFVYTRKVIETYITVPLNYNSAFNNEMPTASI